MRAADGTNGQNAAACISRNALAIGVVAAEGAGGPSGNKSGLKLIVTNRRAIRRELDDLVAGRCEEERVPGSGLGGDVT